jgi:hypothetical protein
MTVRRAVGVGLLVGTIGWLLIWFQTEPRANFDSLIYHADAFEYAGMTPEAADAASWTVYERYASDLERTIITDTVGGEWSTPVSDRWMGLYQMRPVYPALVALAHPVLGLRGPMAVSALVTVAFVVITFAGFGLLAGFRVATIATGAALLQVNFTHWLVFLTTDGVAMLLWAASLVAIALYAKSGLWPWRGRRARCSRSCPPSAPLRRSSSETACGDALPPPPWPPPCRPRVSSSCSVRWAFRDYLTCSRRYRHGISGCPTSPTPSAGRSP